ncbi:hypothetical protein FGG08_002834 [Glutinoglossum americanum]|uniref:UBC core domain-containing protein n=1 Tax=Glutinoglossum americanum TaxID=1670608 RepID=A0A9P8HZG3_9PEZI|nr:hypothetical protein FGG08_002834 [Glutinoglossum americanum]
MARCFAAFPLTNSRSKIEDHGPPVPPTYALSYDEGMGSLEFANFKRTGIPPRNYVLIAFCNPAHGYALFNRSKITLLDRYLHFGQVVKRNMTDAMSGTITRLRTELTLRPSFPGLMLGDRLPSVPPVERPSTSESARASWLTGEKTPANDTDECLLEMIPAEELVLAHEFMEGDYIIYNSWLGSVEDVIEEVTIQLGNGGVVVVEDPTKLGFPILAGSIRRPSGITAASLSSLLRQKAVPADRVSVGQYVVTSKGNLRRGTWKYGAYNPSITPHGYVVDVRATCIEVLWHGQNPMVPGRFVPVPQPPAELNSDILNSGQVRRYDSGRMPRTSLGAELPGLAHMPEIQSGDRVRFKDLAGAVMKYDGSTRAADGRPCGKVVKIPRTMSQGYDVNTFVVIETKSVVNVLWQDLTETKENGTALVPYQNTDDHDVWPGEIVAIKEEANSSFADGVRTGGSPGDGDSPIIRPKRVGVVQSVNSLERMAKVRWFINPELEMIGKSFPFFILPGSKLGELSHTVEDVSLYELSADPALPISRGDFVLVAPPFDLSKVPINDSLANLSNIMEGAVTTPSTYPAEAWQPWLADVDRMPRQMQTPNFADTYTSGGGSGHRSSHSSGRMDPTISGNTPIDWFGEVVDLRLDGLATVRLGALDQVKDITVSVERLTVVDPTEGDDSEDNEGSSVDGGEGSCWSSLDPEESNPEEVMEVEYEGGQRWDSDGDEEMWTTETEDEADESLDVIMTDGDTGSNPAIAPETSWSNANEDSTTPSLQIANSQLPDTLGSGIMEPQTLSTPEARPLSAHPNQPAQFAVLDSNPPTDHAFIGKSVDIPAGNARRIRKEHKILENSLPNGIFVRTWESRIDLLRVLIIGPRNTPYELAPFVLDFQFGSTFPASPPLTHFHSWTNGIGRINPNLYEDGKVCLSLLGTWPGQSKNEAWSSTQSSMLQVLVSLMGLVLVKEPFYNEAGFDILLGAEETIINSALYTEKAFVLARGFVKHALTHPIQGLEDVIRSLYLQDQHDGSNLLREVIQQCKSIIYLTEHSRALHGTPMMPSEGGAAKLSAGALVLLKRNLTALEEVRAKFVSPASVGATN